MLRGTSGGEGLYIHVCFQVSRWESSPTQYILFRFWAASYSPFPRFEGCHPRQRGPGEYEVLEVGADLDLGRREIAHGQSLRNMLSGSA